MRAAVPTAGAERIDMVSGLADVEKYKQRVNMQERLRKQAADQKQTDAINRAKNKAILSGAGGDARDQAAIDQFANAEMERLAGMDNPTEQDYYQAAYNIANRKAAGDQWYKGVDQGVPMLQKSGYDSKIMADWQNAMGQDGDVVEWVSEGVNADAVSQMPLASDYMNRAEVFDDVTKSFQKSTTKQGVDGTSITETTSNLFGWNEGEQKFETKKGEDGLIDDQTYHAVYGSDARVSRAADDQVVKKAMKQELISNGMTEEEAEAEMENSRGLYWRGMSENGGADAREFTSKINDRVEAMNNKEEGQMYSEADMERRKYLTKNLDNAASGNYADLEKTKEVKEKTVKEEDKPNVTFAKEEFGQDVYSITRPGTVFAGDKNINVSSVKVMGDDIYFRGNFDLKTGDGKSSMEQQARVLQGDASGGSGPKKPGTSTDWIKADDDNIGVIMKLTRSQDAEGATTYDKVRNHLNGLKPQKQQGQTQDGTTNTSATKQEGQAGDLTDAQIEEFDNAMANAKPGEVVYDAHGNYYIKSEEGTAQAETPSDLTGDAKTAYEYIMSNQGTPLDTAAIIKDYPALANHIKLKS